MSDDLKDKLAVRVEVPAWGVIVMVVSGAFAFGALYNKLEGLVKSQDKVEIMYEKQIKNIEAVNQVREALRVHDAKLENHEVRLSTLERAMERNAR